MLIPSVWAVILSGCSTAKHIIGYSRTYDRYAVACDHADASYAGTRVMEAGGNAVDAAVAASFALSVVRPHSCGVGGGGFMLIHLVDDPSTEAPNDPIQIAIDYRERTPAAVEPEHFFDLPDGASLYSGHAVAIPGTVAGLLEAHKRFGILPLREVMEPAIELAITYGYDDDPEAIKASESLDAALGERDDADARWLREAYISKNGSDGVNSVRRNLAQGRLLLDIMLDGRDAFYKGENAQHIINAVQKAGGVMTLEDLANYEPTVSTPIVRDLVLGDNAYTFAVMPPPSSGGVATLQTLGILAHYQDQMAGHVGAGPLDATSPNDPVYAHALIESMKHAFADRARYMGDTEYVDVPLDRMLDDDAWERAAERLHPERTLPTERYGVLKDDKGIAHIPNDHGTSHLSVIDRWGNAVACTETINTVFGSRIPVPELGFVLNNEMDDFLTKPGAANVFGLTQSERNLPAPGKRPLSSMSPTIVLDANGRVVAVAGASGGPRIITATLQALINALHFEMPAGDAVSAPRVHHQWRPDQVYTEAWSDGSPLSLIEELGAIGHTMTERDHIGVVQLLVRRNGVIEGASDPRKGGRPAGQ